MSSIWAAPLAAVSFLTVLPVPFSGAASRVPLGWVMAFYPLGGAFLGALLAGVNWLLSPVLPAGVVAVLLVSALLALTGALHLDGLMDSFDGLFGGKTPERRLAIMKDSRVGSFGIAAAVCLLLAEYSALSAISPAGRTGALMMAAVLSRWGMAALLWGFPAATSTGLAAGLKPHLRWYHLLVATVLAGGAVSWLAWTGVILAAATAALVALAGLVALSKIGGITGDSCGATGELVEAMVLVGFAAWA